MHRLLESDLDPKEEIERFEELPAVLASIEDIREYVEGYMVQFLPSNQVTPENLDRVMEFLPKGGFTDVFRVLRAMSEAGLARYEDLEAAFFEDGD